MAAVVWDLQRCTMNCSCGSLASTSRCSSFEPSDAAFPGGILQTFSSGKRHGRGKQLMTLVVTRSCSPLVESFASTQSNFSYDLNSFSKLDYPGAWNSSSPTTTPAQHHEQSGAVAYKMEEEDRSSQLAPQDPLAAAYGDADHAEKFAHIGHDIDMRRSARTRPPTMSLSQDCLSRRRRSVSHTVGAVGHAVNTTKLPGPMGFAMAFAVAALGLKTAVEKQGFLPSTPQNVCEKCDGYGVQQCHVCQGRGVLTWEGKLRHTDPCPLCFGSCLKKCTSCGGVKMKKGMPPAMATKLQVKAGSNRK